MDAFTGIPPTLNNSNNSGTRPGSGPRGLPPIPPTTTTDYVMTVLFAILIFFILLGNMLVLISFRVNRRLRTKTNFFISSLAFADLSIGVLSVPYYVYSIIEKPRNNSFYPYWLAIDVAIGVSAIMNLTMISMERAYALLRPIEHRSMSKVKIVLMIVVAWSLGIFAGSLFFVLEKVSPKTRQMTYGIIVFSVFFAVPLTIIIVTYAIIFKIASAHARGRGVRSFKKDLRIATTVAVVIGCFTINWLPFFSLNFFFTVCRYYSVKLCWSVPQTLGTVTKLMQYMNSAVNPMIYGFRNKDFKVTFKKILYKLCGKEVAISSYHHSTYTTRHTKKFIRSESSFDGDSVIYPDQIVPPGMYDMRSSYRSAITRGARKTPPKKSPAKGLAQGLMSLHVETFSMPTTSSEVNSKTLQSEISMSSDVSKINQSHGVNCNTAGSNDRDVGAQSSLDIEVYPIQKTSRDNEARNNTFMKSQENVTKGKPGARVHFDTGNGVINGGLCNDDKVERNSNLEIPFQKEHSKTSITADSLKENNNEKDRRSISFT